MEEPRTTQALIPLARAEEITVNALHEVEAMYRSALEKALTENARLLRMIEEAT